VRACTKWMEGRTGGLERRIKYFGACKSRHRRFQPDGWTVARRGWNLGRKTFERASPRLTLASPTCGVARSWFGVCRPTGRGPKVFRARVHAGRARVHPSGAAVHVFRWRFKPAVECFQGRRAASQGSPSPFRGDAGDAPTSPVHGCKRAVDVSIDSVRRCNVLVQASMGGMGGRRLCVDTSTPPADAARSGFQLLAGST